MKFKAKSLNLSAGRPVAIMHLDAARALGVHVDDRVQVTAGKIKIIAIVDTILSGFFKEDEIALSEEVMQELDIKTGDVVDADPVPLRQSAHYIFEKLSGMELTEKKIFAIIEDIVDNALAESEIAYFISAMYTHGMSSEEIAFLTKAMVKTGTRLFLKKKIIADKHSIGGIPNNRTTPIIVSICATAGLTMPKTSSRAITSAAGTADVIEIISPVEFSIAKMKKIVYKTGGCIVWGGALGLAPSDDKIIQVERLIYLDPEAQLIASILAKKLAVGSTHILLDIPYGESAKVDKKEAVKLSKKFKKVAKILKLNIQTILTDGKQPIGNGIGPLFELRDVLSILKREKNAPKDLEQKSVMLAGKLLEMTGKCKKGEGEKIAMQILNSGQALKKFKEIISAQGGNINRINKLKPKFFHHILADKNGKVSSIQNKKIAALARRAGAPADKTAGIYLYKHLSNILKKGEKILTIYSETKDKLKEAVDFYKFVKPIEY